MNLVLGNSVSMAKKSLDFLWKKQEATMTNIANVDTPGYKSKYVTFEETFQKKLEDARTTGKSKMVRNAIDSARTELHTAKGESARLDKNTVDMDVESAELARTAIQYQYVTGTVSSDIARYRTAIKG